MRDTRLVKWAKEVERTPLLQNTTKVLLLGLYIDGIDAEWKVSIPRAAMADRMGVSTRQVERRIEDAVRVGFLRQEIHGWKGTTAVYMASLPKSDAVLPLPRRARSGREPWLRDDPKARRFQGGFGSESSTRGGGALPVDNTACRAKARHAGGEPVVTQATAEPVHPNWVPNITATATLADAGTCADDLAVIAHGWLSRNLDHLGTIHPSHPATVTARADLSGQNSHQEDERPETQAKADLSTVDLAELAAGQAGQW